MYPSSSRFRRPPDNYSNNNHPHPRDNPNLIPSLFFIERYGLMQSLQKNGCSLIFNLNEDECNGSVDVILNNEFYSVKNPSGNIFTPAYISFAKEKLKIGETGLKDYRKNPKCVIFDIMRILGKSTTEIEPHSSWQFTVSQNPGYPYLSVFEVETWDGRKCVTPEFALALYLKGMKRYAEAVTKRLFKRVAIVIPGYYSKIHHTALKTACTQAGMILVYTMQAPKNIRAYENES